MRRRVRGYWDRFKHLTLKLPRFEVRETDCFLCSYPRSGNTWMRHMIAAAVRPESRGDFSELESFFPTINRRDLAASLSGLDGQPYRLFKSHEQFLPHYLKGKVAYLIRDGRDVMVSYHHYADSLCRKPIELSNFVRECVDKRRRRISWSAHVRGWLAHLSHPNVLIVRYHHMLQDAERELRRVLAHFGLDPDDRAVRDAVAASQVRHINKVFEQSATLRDKSFDGGLGGGRGKGKRLMDAETMAYFMADAGGLLRELGYLDASPPPAPAPARHVPPHAPPLRPAAAR